VFGATLGRALARTPILELLGGPTMVENDTPPYAPQAQRPAGATERVIIEVGLNEAPHS
jgi:hypothetical protein